MQKTSAILVYDPHGRSHGFSRPLAIWKQKSFLPIIRPKRRRWDPRAI